MPISHRRHGKTYQRNHRWLDTYRRLFLLELAQTATCEVFSMQMSCRITVSFRKDCDQIYWNTPSLWVYVAAVVHVRWEKRREIITLELFHLQNQNHRISIVSTEQMHKFCLIRWQRLDTAWHRLTVDFYFLFLLSRMILPQSTKTEARASFVSCSPDAGISIWFYSRSTLCRLSQLLPE